MFAVEVEGFRQGNVRRFDTTRKSLGLDILRRRRAADISDAGEDFLKACCIDEFLGRCVGKPACERTLFGGVVADGCGVRCEPFCRGGMLRKGCPTEIARLPSWRLDARVGFQVRPS
ncbi:MAG: hypothetical protein OXN84_09860 [Albidovulum sp.]|nr:hypothetical protein [Albidovulum sp.]